LQTGSELLGELVQLAVVVLEESGLFEDGDGEASGLATHDHRRVVRGSGAGWFARPRRPVSYTVAAADSESAQEYTPFEGFELTAKVTDTFLRGNAVLTDGEIVGEPRGRYLHRPVRRS